MVAAASVTPRKIGHQLYETLLGQQLVVQEIEYKRTDPRAVLHGRVDAFRKRRPRLRAAIGAAAIVRTMLGDDEGPRGRADRTPAGGAVAVGACVRIQARAAPGAGRRGNDLRRHRVQRPAAGLPRLRGPSARPVSCRTGPAGSSPAPASAQPIARRRLAAIRAVQPEPALEPPPAAPSVPHSRPQGPRPARAGLPATAHAANSASYPNPRRNRKPASAVERIFSSNPAAA